MKKLVLIASICSAAFVMTGCATSSRVIAEGETDETIAGFGEDDIRMVVSKVVQDINRVSARYSTPEKPVRVVNVKNVRIDTLSRGNSASYLAETIAQCMKEALTEGGKFYVYNEVAAQRAALAGRPVPYTPQFVLESTLRQRNMRRDNGDITQEYSLNIQLVDVATSIEFWQKRVPLRKVVDKNNAMN